MKQNREHIELVIDSDDANEEHQIKQMLPLIQEKSEVKAPLSARSTYHHYSSSIFSSEMDLSTVPSKNGNHSEILEWSDGCEFTKEHIKMIETCNKYKKEDA